MARSIHIRPKLDCTESGVVTRVTAKEAGWDYLNFEMRRFLKNDTWRSELKDHEAALVLLGGKLAVKSSVGDYEIDGREHVFDGLPHAIYFPRKTSLEVTALADKTEIAYCWVPTDQDNELSVVTPDEIKPELRGGNSATRQIHAIIPPGYKCQRIVSSEAYTPSGNWSSYPPHKHDKVVVDSEGQLLEADLEEIYFYKFNRPDGFAFQRVYTDDGSLDEVVVARDNDIVLVPEGYHPVSAAYGYDCYYLNFLAGTHQSLAATDDPAHKWVKDTWDKKDPRLPLVTHKKVRALS
jgi:Uncharacterized enzyme involved in inositol metabolism